MDDQIIISLFHARDEQAIRETQRKYGKLCYHIAHRIVNNHEDAEECVNDTYLGLWNSIPPARPRHLTAFICGIVRNQSLKRIEAMSRQKRSGIAVVSLSELDELLPDESLSTDLSLENLGTYINDFLKKEKTDVRNVFLRRYYFFDSVEEIAKQFSFSESKVKAMLFRTRHKLKQYLIGKGVTI